MEFGFRGRSHGFRTRGYARIYSVNVVTVRGVDRYGTAGHVPQYLDRGNTVTSDIKVILFHQNAYLTLMSTKKLQLLGDVPKSLPWFCPGIPLGDFRPLNPLLCPPTAETYRRHWSLFQMSSMTAYARVMDFSEHCLEPLLICRDNYSNYHTRQ